jgi:xylulokinase
VYGTTVFKTSVDQDAAALGAAALAAVGTGMWESFQRIDELHRVEDRSGPDPERSSAYEALMPAFAELANSQARLADLIPEVE